VQRKRRSLYLSREERENISRGLASALSIRAIARTIARSPSTVSREISRNGGILAYRAMIAVEESFERALWP
jgi:IS30 family transposase